MIEKSDKSVAEVLALFNRFDLKVGLLVPTKTAMEKGIMDATAAFRDFLVDAGLHDYRAQSKGPSAKVVLKAYFVEPNGLKNAKASFYRPETKDGDPRVWFYGLGEYAQPYNLLAVLAEGGELYVVNCSNDAVLKSIEDPSMPLGALAAKAKAATEPVVAELLGLLRAVCARGFIRTVTAGDTGVGATLENVLGIPPNARRTPDYKGIELKSKRWRKGQGNRATLFSQIPDWSLSPVGTAWKLLQRYGYEKEGRKQLYHELNAKAPNSLGLMLEVDAKADLLKQVHVDADGNKTHVATWKLGTLRDRLLEKHPQTFWVEARQQGAGVGEEFHYVKVTHTKGPSVQNFEALLEAGLVSLDYTLSVKNSEKQKVRDHGYLFKIHPRDFGALFPPPDFYKLEE